MNAVESDSVDHTSMTTTELLPGWTVASTIPPDVIDGLARGIHVLHGGVVENAPGTDGAGQSVLHLLPAGRALPDIVPADSIRDVAGALTTRNLLQATTCTMALSGMNLAVSAVGFAVLYGKLTELDKRLAAILQPA